MPHLAKHMHCGPCNDLQDPNFRDCTVRLVKYACALRSASGLGRLATDDYACRLWTHQVSSFSSCRRRVAKQCAQQTSHTNTSLTLAHGYNPRLNYISRHTPKSQRKQHSNTAYVRTLSQPLRMRSKMFSTGPAAKCKFFSVGTL